MSILHAAVGLAFSIALFAQGNSGAKLTGKITALPASGLTGNWTVAGRTVQVNAQTRIETESGPAVVGACVDVRGTASNSGNTIQAQRIETRPASQCDRETPSGEVEIFGPVEGLPSGSLIGDWRVGGTVVRVNAQTEIEQKAGPVAIGSCAEVEGTRNNDGSLLARSIEVTSGIGGCRNGNDNNPSQRPQLEFRGTVTQAPTTPTGNFTISGRTVVVNAQTQIRGGGNNLRTGDCVDVEGRYETNGNVTASRIQILGSGVCRNSTDDRPDVSFYGRVTALPANTLIGNWTVGGRTIVVNSDTRIENENGNVAVNSCVQIRGDFSGANIVATRIDTRPSSSCDGTSAFRFDGGIQQLPASGLVGTWRVAGRNVIVDSATTYDLTRGSIVLNACITVIGTLQADGSVRATRIEVLSSNGSCIATGGIVGAGNLAGFGVAPQQIISIFGRQIGPATTLPMNINNGRVDDRIGNTRVLFDGTAARLLFASEGQINAIVPCNVAGKQSVQVQVESNGAWTNVVTLPVYATNPSIFTISNSGRGPGAILNYDSPLTSSINSSNNAIARGGVATIFATGEGQTTPACSDGAIVPLPGPLPRPVAPVSVEIGGRAASVQYAGGAPGLVSGVLQVNVTIPADAPVGPNIPIVLKVGDRTSQQGVTISIK